jgi:hypothetical protein
MCLEPCCRCICSPIATRTLGKAGRLNIVSSVSVSGLNYCAEIYGLCGSEDVIRDGALDARCALPLAKPRLRYSHRSCQRSKRPVTKQAVSFASITVKTKRYYGLHLAYRTSQSDDICSLGLRVQRARRYRLHSPWLGYHFSAASLKRPPAIIRYATAGWNEVSIPHISKPDRRR